MIHGFFLDHELVWTFVDSHWVFLEPLHVAFVHLELCNTLGIETTQQVAFVPGQQCQVRSYLLSVRSTVFFALEKHPIKYVKITCREGQQDQITVPSALFCKSLFNFASNASDTHPVRIPGWLFEEVTWFAVLQCLANKEPGQNEGLWRLWSPFKSWIHWYSTPWPKHACGNYILVGMCLIRNLGTALQIAFYDVWHIKFIFGQVATGVWPHPYLIPPSQISISVRFPRGRWHQRL